MKYYGKVSNYFIMFCYFVAINCKFFFYTSNILLYAKTFKKINKDRSRKQHAQKKIKSGKRVGPTTVGLRSLSLDDKWKYQTFWRIYRSGMSCYSLALLQKKNRIPTLTVSHTFSVICFISSIKKYEAKKCTIKLSSLKGTQICQSENSLYKQSGVSSYEIWNNCLPTKSEEKHRDREKEREMETEKNK